MLMIGCRMEGYVRSCRDDFMVYGLSKGGVYVRRDGEVSRGEVWYG